MKSDHTEKEENEQQREDLEKDKVNSERRALREANISAATKRPATSSLKNLDSSIKRNTAFIKKLKNLSEESKDSLCQELLQLNLSRYISEVVNAIAEAKLKFADINAAVKICSLLHQRYSDFAPSLIPTLTKFLSTKPQSNESEQEKNSRQLKKRGVLKLLAELFIVAVYSESEILLNILQEMVSLDTRDSSFSNISLIVSFTRAISEELLGILPRKQKEASKEPPKEATVLLTAAQQKDFLTVLESYFDSVCRHLLHEHRELRAKERENHHILETKGELSEVNVQTYDKLRKSFEKLQSNVSLFAEVLNRELPALPKDQNTTRIEAAPVPTASSSKESTATVESVFDDEDTRSFYETFPDIRVLVPGVLFGDSEPKDKESDAKESAKKDTADTEADSKHTNNNTNNNKKETAAEEKENEKDTGAGGTTLDALLQRLPQCVNRDMIDQLSIDFCYINSKSNRKKLVKALFNVPRTQLALIPYYGRMVATLQHCIKDIGPMLLAMLEEEFQYLYQKKDQINIETKIRNIRFLGELCKFKICPAAQILSFFNQCLDDFVHHNVEIACHLLETCGRYLHRTPETHVRTKNLLDKMMRLKHAQNLHNRLDTMVENAYYQCVPPDRAIKKHKEQPPLHLYINKLIYQDLNKNSVKYVVKQLRKMPWSADRNNNNDNNENNSTAATPSIEDFICNALLRVYKGKYVNIHLMASIAAGLSMYHEALGIKLVDALLEEIIRGLEENNYRLHQRLTMYIKFLGELYNYTMIESNLIFDTLYTLITFGHVEGSAESAIDPSTDFFRVRLVCTLLDTCGQYFDRGSSKKKLDKFLVYFQRYILAKSYLPMDVDFMLSDCFDALRPNLARYHSVAEATQEILRLEQEELQQQQQQAAHQKTAQFTASSSSSSSSSAPGSISAARTAELRSAANKSDMSDSYSESSDDEEEEDEEDDTEDDVDEEGEEETEEEEEEDLFAVRRPIHVPSPEDEEFDKEFKKILHESLEARKLEARQSSARMDMSVPMHLLKSAGIRSNRNDDETAAPAGDEEKDSVPFKLLMKRGNKQAVRSLHIPTESPLAIMNASKRHQEREEQQELKRRVLEYEEREEEADAHDTAKSLKADAPRGNIVINLANISTASSSSSSSSSAASSAADNKPSYAGRGSHVSSYHHRGGRATNNPNRRGNNSYRGAAHPRRNDR